MKMSEYDAVQGKSNERQQHIGIDNALNELEKHAEKIRDFVTGLSDVPGATTPNNYCVEQPVPTFLSVYSNIEQRIHNSSKNIAESMQLIKDMLL